MDEVILRRFLAKVRLADNGCLEWQGSRNSNGYGQLRVGKKLFYVHRLAYEQWIGPIPDGADVLHSCDNPPCVLREHLHPGTPRRNGAEMRDRRRHPNIRLTAETAAEIRRLYSSGKTATEVAVALDVHRPSVYKIIHGRQWVPTVEQP